MGPGGENPPVGPETQGSAGPGEIGEPRTDNQRQQRLPDGSWPEIKEDTTFTLDPKPESNQPTPVTSSTEPSVIPETVELDHDLGPVTETPSTESATTPETENITPRQKAENMLEADKLKDIKSYDEEIQKIDEKKVHADPGVKKAMERNKNNKVEQADRKLETLRNLPDSVVEIILPAETMGGWGTDKLSDSIDNFRTGKWGFQEGKAATIIMPARTTIPQGGDKGIYVAASSHMIANTLANGYDYREISGDRWAITIPKE